MTRRNAGRETWNRLLDWDVEQAASERLASLILRSEGYVSIDPSHPLGGRDGGKDILCKKDGINLVGAVYFPRGQQRFNSIKKKFYNDLEGVEKNKVNGIVFLTNQELTLSERKTLEDINKDIFVEIYHLEKISNLLDSPINYGIRLEFLDIEFTKEELLSYQAFRDKEYYEKTEMIYKKVKEVIEKLDKSVDNLIGYSTGGESYGYIDIANINLNNNIKTLAFFSQGEYSLFNIGIRLVDLDDVITFSMVDQIFLPETMPEAVQLLNYDINLEGKIEKRYNIFYSARNGFFTELFRLYKIDDKWVSAIRVLKEGNIIFEKVDDKISENIDWN